MGDMLRSTVCRTPEFMKKLFVTYLRPHIDFCSCVWNVGYLADVRRLESLQRTWTKEIAGFSGLSYRERLRKLDLYSIYGRLLRKDLIKVWCCFHLDSSSELQSVFELAAYDRTRGHSLKLSIPVCRTELRRRFLSVRCVKTWNSLPSSVVESESIHSFKTKLGSFLGERLFFIA